MKLWILRPTENLPDNDNPWDPWYDKTFGFVIRAESEHKAREIAQENAGGEERGEFLGVAISNTKEPWADHRYSTCEELTPDGDEGVIIEDYASA